MSTLVIEGGHRLHGRLDVEGNKNAALPLIAACLLTNQPCILSNVPRIADVEVMCRLLLIWAQRSTASERRRLHQLQVR
jgi:UDP-N-acetylglucosamine 1-carboxyvinyltransferase